jgi:hypothetical protein
MSCNKIKLNGQSQKNEENLSFSQKIEISLLFVVDDQSLYLEPLQIVRLMFAF